MNFNTTESTNGLFSIIESDGRSFIELSKVVRFIADGGCAWVIFKNGEKVLTTRNIGYYEKILPAPDVTLNNSFYRTHHKHLINLSFMKKYNSKRKLILLQTHDQIPLAQRRAKGFTAMLKRFSLY